ncbi:U-box domain-containing protein 6-like [Curcuma longa]|uniref:U-box domain-containing protein 6-like n=1 Tax=Curcuma longa TaxID=136217 RepID=UPI003D9F639A
MDSIEAEENLYAASDAKLHGEMCKQLSAIAYDILKIFPSVEDAKPRSKSGIQALCSLHVAIDKAKNILRHCSECSKLYLAITSDSVLAKFNMVKSALEDSLRLVHGIVPQQDIGRRIKEIMEEVAGTSFVLDQSEKQVGDEVISLLQKEKRFDSDSNDYEELKIFRQAVLKLGITSYKTALLERRSLKKMLENARAEEDERKESIVAYLLHLMRKYSKLFRNELPDVDADFQQGSCPSSPNDNCTVQEKGWRLEKRASKLCSINFKQSGVESGNSQVPPEELRCPISLQLMFDPVIISSGQTYERVCIEKWFGDGHSTCPKTRQQLSHLCLTPNYCVKGLIVSWCEQNGVAAPSGPPESLDLNYWRLALSVPDNKTVPPENGNAKTPEPIKVEETVSLEKKDDELDEVAKCENMLAALNQARTMEEKRKAAEKIRLLLKNDEEARIYMGASGFLEVLVQFLKSAVDEGDEPAQETAAMALFNLAVNNNRNKEKLVSAGVMQLLEEMIRNPKMQEAAAALYLNLSCLESAKLMIGSSQAAVHFLVQLLQATNCRRCCKHDALYALYNLSTHPANVAPLLSAGVINILHSLIAAAPAASGNKMWVEKALAVLINLSSTPSANREIVSTAGLIAAMANVLENGEAVEQEQAASCFLLLCEGDMSCSHMVLQEGVIPSLVCVSVNGTPRGREKAQRLLKLFREQRQREMVHQSIDQTSPQSAPADDGAGDEIIDSASGIVSQEMPLKKARSRRLGRAFTLMWKLRGSWSLRHHR